MTTETVVVLDPITPATADRLRGLLPPGLVLTHGSARDEAHLQSIIAEADYAISGQIGVSGAVLEAARRLKLLHKWGVGVDNLDLDAARRLGIKVARTTGSNAVPVAELTLGLMISTLRSLSHSAAELGQGRWVGGNFARPARPSGWWGSAPSARPWPAC
jgi:phosphoglycerate dehydrogenase-like enzyme